MWTKIFKQRIRIKGSFNSHGHNVRSISVILSGSLTNQFLLLLAEQTVREHNT